VETYANDTRIQGARGDSSHQASKTNRQASHVQ
jgi:hypothetical protein